MEIELFEHNEEGYKKLVEMLKESNYATINHATGTGKSFIALKYISDNKDKKGLYIAPTYEILNQVTKRDAKTLNIEELNMDTIIYRNLLKKNIRELFEEYDYFILDEYHRAGANKSGKKIKELKLLIDESNTKKMIGLTATPIRYLDKERNMTEELFDGNIASYISLPEALIDGILPVPTYITTAYALKEKLAKTEASVNRLAPCKLKTELNKRLNVIRKKVEEEQELSNTFDKYINRNGKYIIFCSTIIDLNETIKKSETWFKNFENINIYKVHSAMKREEIKKEIERFDESNEGLNLMYSIDIFSEGVHPKDVDGVIFNRRSTSPIIILQQMGRAMSASHNGSTIIIDLKNNFSNHPAIQNISEQLKKLANERILIKPDKKEEYKSVLDNFKLIDETSKLIEELNDIKSNITSENIINSKIEYTINLLEKYKRDNNIKVVLSDINITSKLLKYYNYLFKYEDYITINQLAKLKEINVLLPPKLMVSLSERLEQLEGYQSEYLKIKDKNQKAKIIILKYLEKNMINKDNKLFPDYTDMLIYSDEETKKQIKKLLKNKRLKIWEKLLLDISVTEDEILKHYSTIKNNYSNKNIPEYLKESLKKSLKYQFDGKEEIGIYLKEIDEQKKEKEIKASEKIEYLLNLIENKENDINSEEFMNIYASLYKKERLIIKKALNKKIQSDYNQIIDKLEKTMPLIEFIKICKYLDEDNLNLFRRKILEDLKNICILLNYISNSENKEKNTEEYDYLLNNNLIDEIIVQKNIKLDSKSLTLMIINEINQLKLKEFTCRYILYYLKNQRRPLINSKDSQEIYLAEEYNENMKLYSEIELNLLNNIINTKESLKKTSKIYAENKVRQMYLNSCKSKRKC